MREVPLSHSCCRTGLCISGGRTPADRGHDIRRAEGLPRGRGKTSPSCWLPHRLFLLGEVLLFALEGAGQGRARVSPCRGGDLASGPVRQTGEGRLEIFLRGRHAGSRRGMSARLRCFGNFFRTACEKKPSRVDVKTYFMTPGFLARAGRLFCLPKRENQQ